MSIITHTSKEEDGLPTPAAPSQRRRNLYTARHCARTLVKLLESICLLLTVICTALSPCYYHWESGTRSTSVSCGLFQPCFHDMSSAHNQHVSNMAKGFSTGIRFAEVFSVMAVLMNVVTMALYSLTKMNSKLPSGALAWAFLAKAHAACMLSLLLQLITCTAILSDLGVVLEHDYQWSYGGTLQLSWGFAFNLAALLAHLVTVLVLASPLSSMAGPAMNTGVATLLLDD